MRKITQAELDNLLANHEKWIKGIGNKRLNIEGVFADWKSVTGRDLSRGNIRRCKFSNVLFRRVNFRAAHIEESVFNDCCFEDCDFSQAWIYDTDFRYSQFGDCKLDDTDMVDSALWRTTWEKCYSRELNLQNSSLRQANFAHCRFPRLELGGDVCIGQMTGLPVYQCVRGFGRRDGTLTVYARGKRENWQWYAGCFEGSETALRDAIKNKYSRLGCGKRYLKAIDYLIDIATSAKNGKDLNTKQKENNNE